MVDVDQELWLFGHFNHNQSGPYSATTTTITEMTMTFFRQINIFNNEIITNGKDNDTTMEKAIKQQKQQLQHQFKETYLSAVPAA